MDTKQQLHTSPVQLAGASKTHRSRTFSSLSEKSGGGGGGGGNDAPSSPSSQDCAERERRDSFLRGESKANPNAAILELDPQARQVVEKVTLDSIRTIQVKDIHGNVITEPDLSNPTRPRWERPLDTIRSFERAIDGDYARRSSYRNQASNQHPSRRTSYYGSQAHIHNRQQMGGGYYSQRPESIYDAYGAPQGQQALHPRQRYGYSSSEPNMGNPGRRYGGHGGHTPYQYPNTQCHTSYESGSDGTGPWTTSTDPSSQNSSYERLHGLNKQPQTQDNVGERAGGQYAIAEDTDSYGFPPRPPTKNNYGAEGMAPSPPEPVRKLIQLGGSVDGSAQGEKLQQAAPLSSEVRPRAEKRQSWLGRRFSRSSRAK